MLDGRFFWVFGHFSGRGGICPKKRKNAEKLMLLQVVHKQMLLVLFDAVTIDVAIVVVVAVGLSEKL